MPKKQKKLNDNIVAESSKAYFKLVSDAELEEILNKNKNLFQLKEVEPASLPLIGIVNCNK